MWTRILQKFVKFIDPILERYREHRPEVKKVEPPYSPKTLEDFIGVIQRTPKSVLSRKDRERIAAIMSFDDRKVGELMVPKDKMIFVDSQEMLGPLTLDKLYKSGFMNFPVLDGRGKIKGILCTAALNALAIKKTDKAGEYIDKQIYYLHVGDSLEFAIEEINNTSSDYFLVLDENEAVAGFFTVQMLLDYLI